MVIHNKKGWIRILEATIAILLVTSVLIVSSSTTNIKKSSAEEEIIHLEGKILRQISSSEELRSWALGNRSGTEVILLKQFVDSQIPENLGNSLELCDVTDPCNLNATIFTQTYDKEFFVDERIIASNITNFKPTKLKLFVWVK